MSGLEKKRLEGCPESKGDELEEKGLIGTMKTLELTLTLSKGWAGEATSAEVLGQTGQGY